MCQEAQKGKRSSEAAAAVGRWVKKVSDFSLILAHAPLFLCFRPFIPALESLVLTEKMLRAATQELCSQLWTAAHLD